MTLNVSLSLSLSPSLSPNKYSLQSDVREEKMTSCRDGNIYGATQMPRRESKHNFMTSHSVGLLPLTQKLLQILFSDTSPLCGKKMTDFSLLERRTVLLLLALVVGGLWKWRISKTGVFGGSSESTPSKCFPDVKSDVLNLCRFYQMLIFTCCFSY